MPVAGEFDIPDCLVALEDSFGFFTESIPFETDTQITVEPRTPQKIHVGQGGVRSTAAYGEHESTGRGSGMVPAGLHRYVAGESTRRIDWKATARLGEAYVREFDAETNRQLALVMDHRQQMAEGLAGATMFEYAREVALGFVRSAENVSDPVGLYTFGDQGLTTQQQPAAGFDDYRAITTRLQELEPTSSSRSPLVSNSIEGSLGPATTQRIRNRLATDDSSFGHRLQPFFGSTDVSTNRIEGNPLVEAIQHLKATVSNSLWTVLFTSDMERNQIREAVQLACRGNGHVIVFPYSTRIIRYQRITRY